MPRSILGPRIRERRRALGITQAELARQVGISASYLNLIERNRRGIAGKRLKDIAEALGLRLADLDGAAEQRLHQTLEDLARDPRLADLCPEAEAVGELIGRYPGWARAIGALARAESEQAALLRTLTDRLTHDPYLGATVHRMLTRIAAIRSTAEILDGEAGLDPDLAARFNTIVHEEAKKLSDIAEALAAYFDKAATPERRVTPIDEVEGMLEDAGNRFAAIEDALATAPPARDAREARMTVALRAGPVIERLVEEADGIRTASGRKRALSVLTRYAEDAAAAPMEDFAELAARHDYDIERIAAEAGFGVDLVCRRLTALPREEGLPEFGYVALNAAGAVTDLRAIRGFHPMRDTALCPLWVTGRAPTRPGEALRQAVALPNGRRFVFVARTRPLGAPSWGMPRLHATDLLVIPEESVDATVYRTDEAGMETAEEVGFTCRLCPRKGCAHRLDEPLLGEAPPVG